MTDSAPMRTTGHTPMLSPASAGLFSVNGLARYLGISRWTVYRLVREGELPAVKVGQMLRFRPSDIEVYLEGGSREERGRVV